VIYSHLKLASIYIYRLLVLVRNDTSLQIEVICCSLGNTFITHVIYHGYCCPIQFQTRYIRCWCFYIFSSSCFIKLLLYSLIFFIYGAGRKLFQQYKYSGPTYKTFPGSGGYKYPPGRGWYKYPWNYYSPMVGKIITLPTALCLNWSC